MRKTGRLLALVLAVVLMTSILTACGKSEAPKTEAPKAETKKEPVSITVWSHLTEPEVAEVKKLAEAWAGKTGNKVTVVLDKSDFQAFATAAQGGKGPDIMFGIAHDNLGTFQKAGLLAEVPSGVINDSDYVPMSLQAVSYGGKKYGVPLSMESYALFYNTKLVKEPPKDWKSFIETAKQTGFVYDVNNFYFSYAFISGNGGYVFKNTGGGLDANDIGLDNDGAKKAFTLLKDFVQTYKFMPADINSDIAKGKFQSGKAGLYISGPWDVDGFKKANVPFAVTTLPTLEDGKTPMPFVGVYAAFVSAKSKNQEASWDLMKYLAQNSVMPLFKAGNRIPVIKAQLDNPEVKANEIVQAFGKSAATGQPMPNIPAMAAVWAPAADSLKLITTGKQPVDAAAKDMVEKIKKGIAAQK